MPVGMAFGVVATSDTGFTPLQAIACSATALAGAGQFIGLTAISQGAGVLGVIAATTVVNLRYVLFAATLSPHLARAPLAGQAALAFSLTDETFAVNISDTREGEADGWSMAAVGAIAWAGWVLGTAIGALAGPLLGDPSRFGVGFAMPAMFTALLVGQVENRRHLVIAAAAAAITLAVAAIPGMASNGVHLIVAPLLAAAIGAAVYRR